MMTSFVFSQEESATDCKNSTSIGLKYLKGSDDLEQNIQLGLLILTDLANDGCDKAQLKLGETYRKAEYVNFDGEKSFYYTKLAADQGNEKAIIDLSKLCEKNIACSLDEQERINLHKERFKNMGCEEKSERAFKFIKGTQSVHIDKPVGINLSVEYATEGCVDSQLKLAKVYYEGKYNITKDADKAFYFAKMAADQQNVEGIKLTSKLCSENVGCTLNDEEKANLYESKLSILPCEDKSKEALKYIKGSSYIAVDTEKGLALLQQYADQDCSQALYELGKLYKKGYKDRVLIDYEKAFGFLERAVALEHPRAHAHLGQLYERGNACKLDYGKASELYKKCYALGDDMGAYCIGYNYMKGLGSIEQDYSQAIEWYGKSEYPMAKHWLAVLNYFGFGMPVNKDKAIELLVSNEGILNSPRLLEHLRQNIDDKGTILSDFKGIDIVQETEKVNEVLTAESENTQEASIVDKAEALSIDTLSGKWKGKLIELDWSGDQIVRSFPINIELGKDTDTGGVSYTANVADKTNMGAGIFLDESLYFQDFKFSIPRLYRDRLDPDVHLDILSADLELKTLNHIPFLTAYVDSRILNWNEPGTPMLLVLSKTSVTTENGVEISDELINELFSKQDDSFITLFPNPFENDLLIQYELSEETNATVELYGIDGNFYNKVVDNEFQPTGKKLYYFDGTELPVGLYVVRITTNSIVYTKLIAKQ